MRSRLSSGYSRGGLDCFVSPRQKVNTVSSYCCTNPPAKPLHLRLFKRLLKPTSSEVLDSEKYTLTKNYIESLSHQNLTNTEASVTYEHIQLSESNLTETKQQSNEDVIYQSSMNPQKVELPSSSIAMPASSHPVELESTETVVEMKTKRLELGTVEKDILDPALTRRLRRIQPVSTVSPNMVLPGLHSKKTPNPLSYASVPTYGISKIPPLNLPSSCRINSVNYGFSQARTFIDSRSQEVNPSPVVLPLSSDKSFDFSRDSTRKQFESIHQSFPVTPQFSPNLLPKERNMINAGHVARFLPSDVFPNDSTAQNIVPTTHIVASRHKKYGLREGFTKFPQSSRPRTCGNNLWYPTVNQPVQSRNHNRETSLCPCDAKPNTFRTSLPLRILTIGSDVREPVNTKHHLANLENSLPQKFCFDQQNDSARLSTYRVASNRSYTGRLSADVQVLKSGFHDSDTLSRDALAKVSRTRSCSPPWDKGYTSNIYPYGGLVSISQPIITNCPATVKYDHISTTLNPLRRTTCQNMQEKQLFSCVSNHVRFRENIVPLTVDVNDSRDYRLFDRQPRGIPCNVESSPKISDCKKLFKNDMLSLNKSFWEPNKRQIRKSTFELTQTSFVPNDQINGETMNPYLEGRFTKSATVITQDGNDIVYNKADGQETIETIAQIEGSNQPLYVTTPLNAENSNGDSSFVNSEWSKSSAEDLIENSSDSTIISEEHSKRNTNYFPKYCVDRLESKLTFNQDDADDDEGTSIDILQVVDGLISIADQSDRNEINQDIEDVFGEIGIVDKYSANRDQVVQSNVLSVIEGAKGNLVDDCEESSPDEKYIMNDNNECDMNPPDSHKQISPIQEKDECSAGYSIRRANRVDKTYMVASTSISIGVGEVKNDVLDEITTKSDSTSYSKKIASVSTESDSPELIVFRKWEPTMALEHRVAYGHVVLLDADDTLIPTSELYSRNYLDANMDQLDPEFKNDLASLDASVTRLFCLLHDLVRCETPGQFKPFLLSVVIVTNAALHHVLHTFDKFYPKLTQCFRDKGVKPEDLVCSARDMYTEEFPFEHFYEFWKAWALEEIMRELQTDGVASATILSIGDDEPERRATAYVSAEMNEFIRGTKVVKLQNQPTVKSLKTQVDHINDRFLTYLGAETSFDVKLGVNERVCEFNQTEAAPIPDKYEAFNTAGELAYARKEAEIHMTLDRALEAQRQVES